MKSKEELDNVLKDNGMPPHPFYKSAKKLNSTLQDKEEAYFTVYKEEAMKMTVKEKIIKGVNKLADTVKVTLGAKGKNVLFNDRRTQRPRITKDGVTAANQVTSDDPIERMAIEIVREAAEKTVKSSGDGTTTTLILAQYIINEGFKVMAKGKSFYELSKEIDAAKDMAITYIKKHSLNIEANFEKLLHIATVSASNTEIGNFIYDIIQDIGVYGHIEVKSSHKTKNRIDKVKGIKYNKGFYAPQFLSDHVRMEWKASKVYIVLFDDTIRSISDLQPYISIVNGDEHGRLVKNNPILFIVNDIEPVVLQTLINNKIMHPEQFNIMITEHDGFGDRKTEIMNDIAALTSASRSTAEEPGQIGFAEEVIVDEDYTSILGGFAETPIVDQLIEITKTRLAEEDISENDKVYYKRRLATLAGGVAVIYVGAPTEVEMNEKKDRIDDAAEAVKAAIDRGISIGGGYTFIKTAEELRKSHLGEGYSILVNSLLEPFEQLCKNSDINMEEIYPKIRDNELGYNVITNEFYGLDDYTIYDPTGVLIDSLVNAVSVAKSILSIEKAIHNI